MQRYLTLLLGLLIGLLLATALLNRLVNPYALFDGPTIDGFNLFKPEVATRQRLAKAYLVHQQRPEVVLLGTSRALALPEQHPHWQGMRVLNLALTSSSIYEQYRYLQHAAFNGPVREAVIGLDHFAFVDSKGGQFRESRLDVDAEGRATPHLFSIDSADLLPALLTFDALRSSLTTLREQRNAGRSRQQQRPKRIAAKGGHHAMFVELERGALKGGIGQPDPAIIGTLQQPGTFRLLLRLAHREGIALKLFISPEHARLWEVWRLIGLAPELARWKRALVTANHEEAAAAGTEPFPLWDFSGYNRITSEPLPPAGDRATIMHGYWEGSHYSDAVADEILQRILGPQTGSVAFGQRLNAETIEAQLRAEEVAGVVWRRQHGADLHELEQLQHALSQSKSMP